MKRTWSALGLTLAFALTGVNAAQVLYKSTMPDGRSIYGERPVPGAEQVETIDGPPAQTGVVIVTPEDKARAKALPAPQGPAVTIIPQRSRPPIQPIQPGTLQNPEGALPKPAEY